MAEMTLKEMMDSYIEDLLGSFLADVIALEMVDISFDYEEKEQWAVVATFREDDELSLRLHSGNRYFLYIGYYDKQDEFQEQARPLSPELIATIPVALHKLMNKVLQDEDGLRVPGSLLMKV